MSQKEGADECSVWFETRDDVKGRADQRVAELLQTFGPGRLDDKKAKLGKRNALGAGVFVAVNEITGNRRTLPNVGRIRAVFGEFDHGLPASGFPLDPTMVVESSPGKFHVYWVSSDLSPEDFDGVMACLVADYGSDKNAKDRTRILRLAGSWHMKNPDAPWKVRIAAESGKTYTREQILDAFPPIERSTPSTDKQVRALKASSAEIAAQLPKIDDALSAIPPVIDGKDIDYDIYSQVGMALHDFFGGDEAGFSRFANWSSEQQRHQTEQGRPGGARDARWRWGSFGNYQGERITIATLFKIAKGYGWQSLEEKVSAETTRLAALHPVLYDRERKAAAKALGCKADTLDALVNAKRSEIKGQDQGGLSFADVEPWPEPVDGAKLLDELTATLNRYAILPTGPRRRVPSGSFMPTPTTPRSYRPTSPYRAQRRNAARQPR